MRNSLEPKRRRRPSAEGWNHETTCRQLDYIAETWSRHVAGAAINFHDDRQPLPDRTQLEGRKKTLEAELKSIKAEIASVSDMVLEAFAEDGVSSVKLDTGETVYMHTQPRASVKAGDWELA